MSTINLKYHPDIESAYAAIRKYELETTSKYILYYREAGFNQKDLDNLDKKKIWWDNHIPFDGIPYCLLGSEVWDCHHGPDRHVNDKKKLVAKKDEMEKEHPYTKNSKKRFLVQSTKKMDCKSQITLKAVVKFPDFKVYHCNNEGGNEEGLFGWRWGGVCGAQTNRDDVYDYAAWALIIVEASI